MCSFKCNICCTSILGEGSLMDLSEVAMILSLVEGKGQWMLHLVI